MVVEVCKAPASCVKISGKIKAAVRHILGPMFSCQTLLPKAPAAAFWIGDLCLMVHLKVEDCEARLPD